MKYITNLSNDPWYNLAFEEYCFRNLPMEDEYVILWINSPAIIVGKNQNTLEEINSEYVEAHNIKVVRRVTGGGAVYHDLGNLNFSIITKVKGEEKIDFRQINIPIVESLEKLGIRAKLSGRNDITLDEMKLSGIAQSIWKKRVLNHGTILFDTDLSVLSNALNVKQEKIESKGIKSVRSRVTNIKPYLKDDVDILTFKEMLLKSIFEHKNLLPEEYILSEEQKKDIEMLCREKYSTWEWNYGESPEFSFKNYKRFPFGSIDIRLNVKRGIIKNCKIFGDFFGTEDVGILEEKLRGVKYNEEEVEKIIEDEPLEKYFGNITKKDFKNLMFK
ncbi:lipoate--protein ligase [Paratissierella segnis]|jgi:lipoate-protein ligase A|uniref:lipoate--protein ligase n=1 Tax=Paratissierella segnis TaxID=2763679 RepID=A0A926EVT6_9FIRM|nr:lipoate--protein ligase [Paratissierella segnis]MBC8588531.1 lipoate--protein ligase [Paratissierella segnis]